MDCIVEFYETATGSCPVREFLDQLKPVIRMTSSRWLQVWQNFAIVSITVSRLTALEDLKRLEPLERDFGMNRTLNL